MDHKLYSKTYFKFLMFKQKTNIFNIAGNLRKMLTDWLSTGGAAVLGALCAAVRDEPGRPLSGRGGGHRPAGHAGAGLVQPLPGHLAEQGEELSMRNNNDLQFCSSWIFFILIPVSISVCLAGVITWDK